MNRKRYLSYLLALLMVLQMLVRIAPAAYAGTKLGPGRYTMQITVGNLVRQFIVYVPASYNFKPTPLVLNFHGGGSDDVQQEVITHMDLNSDLNGYIVCYPNAVDHEWNDGRVVPYRTNYPDVQFVQALVPYLESTFTIDKKRVYTCGFSNGSLFTERLAFEMPTTFAAAGVVAGGLTQALYRLYSAQSTMPIPIVIFHGTLDPNMPYNGGQIIDLSTGDISGRVYSANFTNFFWATHNNDSTQAQEEVLPILFPNNPTSAVKFTYPGPKPVVFFEEIGAGHTWPQGLQYKPVSKVGYVCDQIDGNQQLWDFFKQFTLP